MKYENAWYWDGSLRDIYVLGVNISYWQRVIDWLHTDPYPLGFYLDNERAPLPRDISTIFERRNEIGVFLEIEVENVIVHCHFFWSKEIEFDLDPRQVDSEQKEEGIIDFMRALGKLLDKKIILTAENRREMAFLTYVPEQDGIIHDTTSSLKPIESVEWHREDGEDALKFIARVHSVDENDAAAIIEKLIEAANKPAYEEDE